MNLALHLKLAGALLLLLASAHLFFPRYFGWKEDLAKLSLLNRQMFYVHCFFIVLVLVLFGMLSLFCAAALLSPGPLPKAVLTGFVLFWSARLFIQFFVYDSRLWKGQTFNTGIHIFFSVLWAYYVAVYASALWQQFHS